MDAVQRAGDGQRKLTGVEGPAARGAADLGLQRAAHRLAHGGGVDAETALGLRLDEDVPQVGSLLDVKTDGAADAAVGEKIHLPAEGRDVQILAAVAADGHHVFLAQMEGAGQVYRKGGVAAAVVEHPPPVAEHRGVVGHGPEGEQDGAALPLSGRKKLPPVARELLVVVLIAVIVGQGLDRVGQAHLFQFQLRGLRPHDGGVEDRGELPAVIPIVVFHHKCSPWQRILLFLCYHKVMNVLPQSYERKKNPGRFLSVLE